MPNLIKSNYLIEQTLRGVKRTIGTKPKLERLPITTSLIRLMIDRIPLNNQSYSDKLAFAAMSLGTFGLLRAGEFVQTNSENQPVLRLSSIKSFDSLDNVIAIVTASIQEIQSITRFIVHIAQSKSDPFGRGSDITIANPIAVSAMIRYLIVRPKHFNLNTPLLVTLDGTPYSRDQLVLDTRFHLVQCGVRNPTLYYGHSFRKGGAQSLEEAGVSKAEIQLAGRWNSGAHLLYTTTPMQKQIALSMKMCS